MPGLPDALPRCGWYAGWLPSLAGRLDARADAYVHRRPPAKRRRMQLGVTGLAVYLSTMYTWTYSETRYILLFVLVAG